MEERSCFMSGVLSFIYFILILSVIIIVHELGHLIAAKKFNVYCKEFSKKNKDKKAEIT